MGNDTTTFVLLCWNRKRQKCRKRSATLCSKNTQRYAARHGLSSTQYQKEVDKYYKASYRLAYVDGYYVNGKVKFAAL
ncbi:hypothetical protein [Kordia sp.]|uniref:hypothetical protein n=1 Tax=Kordia sp. TaxID=1965332 RepID=UPI00344BD0C5